MHVVTGVELGPCGVGGEIALASGRDESDDAAAYAGQGREPALRAPGASLVASRRLSGLCVASRLRVPVGSRRLARTPQQAGLLWPCGPFRLAARHGLSDSGEAPGLVVCVSRPVVVG